MDAENNPQSPSQDASCTEQALLAAYASVSARRTSFDTMMWQVPALATTAQAFLMTIALGADTARGSRVLAALLGMVLAVLAAQLMAKYRSLEKIDSRVAEQIERRVRLDRVLGLPPHASASVRADAGVRPPWWIRVSSYRLWLAGLLIFAMVDCLAALAAISGLPLLSK
jgi:hypothetical protein